MSTARNAESTAPRSVLQVSHWLTAEGAGGIQTYLSVLSEAMGDTDTVLSYAALMPGSIPAYVRNSGAVAHLGRWRRPKWVNGIALGAWLSRNLNSFDLVHFHGVLGLGFLIGASVARRRGVPYVVSTHGSLVPSVLVQLGYRARLGYRLKGRHLLRGAAAVLATSEREADLIRADESGLYVRVVPPGLRVPERPVVEHYVDGESDCLRVAFVGRLTPIKAIPVLLAAIACLKRNDVTVRLDVLGTGDAGYVARLEEQAQRLGIADHVAWHGHQTGKPKSDLLHNTHVLVLPSRSESFGFAAVEAMALGLPVIVSDGVGVADTLRRYRGGTVVPCDDATALAEALAAYRDPAYRREMGRRAHTCALREFSLAAMGEGLADVYREAARC